MNARIASSKPPLAIIAGGGPLARLAAEACEGEGRAYRILAIKGEDHSALGALPRHEIALGAGGEALNIAREAGLEEAVFAGRISRPDLRNLRVDRTTLGYMPRIIAGGLRGDAGLHKAVLKIFEELGLRVVGVDEVTASLIAREGAYGVHRPDAQARADIARGFEIAKALGALDIGQAAVIEADLALAVEAMEGTDAMLARVASLPASLRGAPPRGVLVKAAKPGQDARMDLPAIGVDTVARAAQAGLAGIAVEAGAALVIDRAGVARAADGAGLFVVGARP